MFSTANECAVVLKFVIRFCEVLRVGVDRARHLALLGDPVRQVVRLDARARRGLTTAEYS